jgi:hypothetical protein
MRGDRAMGRAASRAKDFCRKPFSLWKSGAAGKFSRQENFRARGRSVGSRRSPRRNAGAPEIFQKKIRGKCRTSIVDTKVDRIFSKTIFNLFDGDWAGSH